MSSKDKRNAVPLYVHAGYGSSESGLTAVEIMLQLYLLQFYVSHVGLDPLWAGLALAIAIAWDAISDPAMGFISDRSQSAQGRRRPWILAGGLLLAAVFPLLFHPPALATQSAKFVFLCISYIAVKTAMTIISVPHAALGGELARDPRERTRAYAFRLLFGNLGLIAGTVPTKVWPG